MSDPACPRSERLEAFARGKLESAAWEAVAEHLDGCEACGRRVDEFDLGPLAAEVAQLAPEDAASPVPAHLTRAAKALSAGNPAPFEDPGARAARSLSAGPQRLDRFELLAELGHGSFGWVFRARDTRLDRQVALKVLRGQADGEDQARFLHEARSAAQLDHPGIVRLFETGRTEDGAAFLVHELVEGETLARRLEHGRLERNVVARWVAELADACAYAHDHGVVHRDVKPSNILVDGDGHPHLTDFGLAKLEEGGVTATPRGEVLGTLAYMAPEQARDARSVDARSDVYSLGVILYEALTGSRPFQGDRRELLYAVLSEDPQPPRERDPEVPRDLERVCLKAMARDPQDRYASAKELAQDLRRFLAGEPVSARPLGRVVRLARWVRRNPLASAVVLAVIVGSGVGWAYLARLTDGLVWSTARHSAELQAQVLEEVNEFYSELVDRLDPEVVPITHEWATIDGALPLPATFTITAGERIGGLGSGVWVRLYSDEPFPWRTDGGPRDDFERRALAALRANPEQTYVEDGTYLGLPAVRLAKARRMEESCLRCHNHHPQTPRDDWRLGEVRGVLEVVRTLEKDTATTGSALRGTTLLAIATTLGLVALGAVVVSLVGRR